MEPYIKKSSLVAEIDRRNVICEKVALDLRTQENKDYYQGKAEAYKEVLDILNTIEEKDMDLIINTIIAECCDWLAICTDLSHDLIEDCRNLMLIIKEEQFKAQKEDKL